MTFHKKRVGTIGPRKFVEKLRAENFMFSGLTQQDAHEFLNYTINEVSDLLRRDEEKHAELVQQGKLPPEPEPTPQIGAAAQKEAREAPPPTRRTWVHEVFGGVLTNETRCLNCECITSRDEDFLDLSVELTQNSSITHCLKSFSAWETLSGDDKFHCDMVRFLSDVCGPHV
jgi:ubiquitin carboxyl-terminal hydrolase 12/46